MHLLTLLLFLLKPFHGGQKSELYSLRRAQFQDNLGTSIICLLGQRDKGFGIMSSFFSRRFHVFVKSVWIASAEILLAGM